MNEGSSHRRRPHCRITVFSILKMGVSKFETHQIAVTTFSPFDRFSSVLSSLDSVDPN